MKENNNNINTSDNVKENGNNINTSNSAKENKNKSLNMMILILILIMLIIIFLVGLGYARYMQSYKGEASAEIAKMVCEMDVNPSNPNDESIINPYCKITVRNYNDNKETSETDVNYTIEVKPKDNIELPDYYWQSATNDSTNEVIISRNKELTGSFGKGVEDKKEYTIVFLNSGEKDILRLVEFNLVAVQGIK